MPKTFEKTIQLLKKASPAVIAGCFAAFASYAGKCNPCNSLSTDISKCSDNIVKTIGFSDLAQSICEDFAANAYSPIEKFKCDSKTLGDELCLNVEIMTERIETTAEAYKNDENSDAFKEIIDAAKLDCSRGNVNDIIVCNEAGTLAGKYKKALVEPIVEPVAPPEQNKKCCSCYGCCK